MVPLPPTTLPPHTPLPLPPTPQHIHLQHSPSAHNLHNTNHTTPMTAFPDGSCLKHQHNQCGYATILLPTSTLTQPNYDFAPHTYVVLDGGSPYTGLNYTAEAMAILRALLAIPLTTPLTIHTDCKGLADHLHTLHALSESQQMKLGSRTVLLNIRRIIHHRNKHNTPTTLIHIYSHTHATTIYTKGNDLADMHAKNAARNTTFHLQRETPFLASPTPFFFVQKRQTHNGNTWFTHHNSNLKKHLAHTSHTHLYTKWASKPKQGTVAKHDPQQLQLLLNTLRTTHHNSLLLFLLLGSCTMLPTPQRLLQYRTSYGAHLQLCPLCHNGIATTEHTLNCDRLQPQHLSHHHTLRTQLFTTHNHLRSLPIPPHPLHPLTNLIDLPWYSLRYTPTATQHFGHNHPLPQLQQQFRKIYQHHHPLSAALGLISPPLQELLLPPPTTLQLPPHYHRAYAKTQRTLLMQTRIQVLTATYNIFSTWQRYAYLHYADNPHLYPPFLKMKPGWLTYNYRQ